MTARTATYASASLALAVIAAAALFSMPTASADDSDFDVTSVKVNTATSVSSTFNQPLDAARTTASQFYAPHLNADTPHVHRATTIAFSNGNRTATVGLDRALHDHATAELNWVIDNVRSTSGETVYDKHWDVWAVGSER